MSKWKAIVNDRGVIFESCLGRGANQIEPVIFREKSKESDYGRLRSGLTRAGCGTDRGDRGSGGAMDEARPPGRPRAARADFSRPPGVSFASACRSIGVDRAGPASRDPRYRALPRGPHAGSAVRSDECRPASMLAARQSRIATCAIKAILCIMPKNILMISGLKPIPALVFLCDRSFQA
ncbi:hypothetical protein QHI69_31265 [Burkholderia gladioli pv. gladioli]|uniref:hypothetical protein n=1 Tax=Burkholderia gladioli TaxID=28095 RepID=UPI0011873AB9|nr:hypothetical protein [Burkholderia gladioli]MDJ1166391.1 hypothetical protein [Burkholderia gladioli pv. gladioli]